ncbi:MAG TPA: FtsX-like permease family protein [Ignavibacteria bacterium]|nr:FtsX-like permease family protein [Ignavibacteria bacterium]
MVLFWIKEAFKLIGRAKSSFFLSLISMSISVVLIAASMFLIKVSDMLQSRIKSNININVFLKNDLNYKDIQNIRVKLEGKNYIKKLSYIDKRQAAQNFIKQTGEDFRKILNYNPLPASFNIILKGAYVQKDSLKRIVKEISKFPSVDEVVFKQKFIYQILNTITKIRKYVFIFTAFLFLISLYIVYSTVKLIIRSKYREMETMKLVGAKLSTIKMPIILNAVLEGFFAGIIAIGLIGIFLLYFRNHAIIRYLFSFHDIIYFIFLICLGPFIGALVSIVSLRKITLKI